MTTLSIVLPTYNRRATLERTLSKCLGLADGLPVDFVIVDDGSMDDTPDYLADLAARERRVTTVSIPNSGPGQARNVGASMAKGDLILFIGDDICPTSADFFRTHIRIHEQMPEPYVAVLGKVVWPEEQGFDVSFVMSLVQGDGGQQFGYAHFTPYARYDWRFFYTANVSIKRVCVDDWSIEGFSKDFRTYGYEDGEFAYRIAQKFGRIDVVYAPLSVGVHYHPYTVETFINRQFAAGLMTDVFLNKHPGTASELGIAQIVDAMNKGITEQGEIAQSDYLAVMDGVYASARLLERRGKLGASAWHAPYLNAVFELAYAQGAIWGSSLPGGNRSEAYRVVLDTFNNRVGRIAEYEHVASAAPLAYASRQ